MSSLITSFASTIRRLAPLPSIVQLRDAQDAQEYADTDRSRRKGLDRLFGSRIAGDAIMAHHIDALADDARLLGRGGIEQLIESLQRMTPAGAVNGSSAYPASAYPACGAQGAPGSVHMGDDDCNRKTCTEDAFNIFSRGKPGFPLPGTANPYPAIAEAIIQDQRPTQKDLLPTRVWATAYDSAAAGQPFINAFITNVQIGNTTMFLGQRMSTAMFAQIQNSVPVQWDIILASVGCNITVGHTLPAQVEMDMYITIWGVPNPTSR